MNDLPRQPESPKYEGVDPLTEGKTLYSPKLDKLTPKLHQVEGSSLAPAAKPSSTLNGTGDEQDEIAKNRKE